MKTLVITLTAAFTACFSNAQSCSINSRGVVTGGCTGISISREYVDKSGDTRRCIVTRGKLGEHCRFFDDDDAPRWPADLLVTTNLSIDDSEGIDTINVTRGGYLSLTNPTQVQKITIQDGGTLIVTGQVEGTLVALNGAIIHATGVLQELEVNGGTVYVTGRVENLRVTSGTVNFVGTVQNLVASGGKTMLTGPVMNLIGAEFVVLRGGNLNSN